jgi:2',3'-cyclic-nucleotide 2'-phosphodiesterase (5'-nucleotidase family)
MFLSASHPLRRPHLLPALVVVLLVAACAQESPPPRRVTIAFSNDMKGEIRSCGCASKDVGGLGRRATFLAALRDTTVADFLLLEGGGFFSPKLNYGMRKADLTLDAMSMMDYDGVVIGEEDLGFGIDYLVRRAREVGLPVVVANLVDARADTLYFPPSRRLTLPSGLPVTLIGVMSPRLRLPPQVEKGTVRIGDPRSAVRRELGRLGPDPGLVILLAHMSRQEVQQLAQEFDQIDLVIHGSEGRAMRKVNRRAGAYVLQVSDRGRYMGVAYAVLDDDGGDIRSLQSAVTPMGKEYEDAPAITRLFEAYDLDIAAREQSDVPSGILDTRKGLEASYAGADACRDCHEDIDVQWRETPHAHAFDILREENREYDRDCTPCHVTGFGVAGGFVRLGDTSDLVHVQCEACHGNASAHVDDPDVATPGDARAACRNCHTVDQTPDFDFDTFWERIRH